MARDRCPNHRPKEETTEVTGVSINQLEAMEVEMRRPLQ